MIRIPLPRTLFTPSRRSDCSPSSLGLMLLSCSLYDCAFLTPQLGLATDISATVVRSGCGPEVCEVLDKLADNALRARQWRFRQPKYPVERVETTPEEGNSAFEGGAAADADVPADTIDDDFDDDEDDEDGQFGGIPRRERNDNDAQLPFGEGSTGARQEVHPIPSLLSCAVSVVAQFERLLCTDLESRCRCRGLAD